MGIIKTNHGAIETPSYVIVGTHAEVRCLNKGDLERTLTQVVIANTYHLYESLRENLRAFPGVHAKLNWNGPVMTDSGGFQVFSLGFGREHGVSKIANIFPEEEKTTKYNESDKNEIGTDKTKNLVRITDKGVYFKTETGKKFLGPKKSIEIQKKLGADIILAFDECTSPLHDYRYTKKSLARTHKWAKICLDEHFKQKSNAPQLLYGIVQGGEWRNLRETSAKFIGKLPFNGFAIGGSLGKTRNDMLKILDWTVPLLPETKPRHLLGIGKIEDLFQGIERGIDTFDCVIPTREARHGAIWSSRGRFDIVKSKHQNNASVLDPDCECLTCLKTKIRKKDLYELFKSKNENAARYATIHNVYFFNNLMKQIRASIDKGKFSAFKSMSLNKLKNSNNA